MIHIENDIILCVYFKYIPKLKYHNVYNDAAWTIPLKTFDDASSNTIANC